MTLTEPTVAVGVVRRQATGYLVVLPNHKVSLIPHGEDGVEALVYDRHTRAPDADALGTDEHGIVHLKHGQVDEYLARLARWTAADGLRKRAQMLRQEAAGLIAAAEAAEEVAAGYDRRAAAVDRYN